MKALVVGGDSKLGRALVERLRAGEHEVAWTTRRKIGGGESVYHLDMLEPALPDIWPEHGLDDPPVVYIMAAITGVVPSESHPDAWRVNAEGALLVACAAWDRGWHVVFMSSGTVERAQHTASARQKTYVESHVLAMDGCVVRPLPVVPPEKYAELGDILVEVGATCRKGVVRWGA